MKLFKFKNTNGKILIVKLPSADEFYLKYKDKHTGSVFVKSEKLWHEILLPKKK